MGPKLQDELDSTPPKLTLTYLPIPSNKTLPSESPWALTPPLHPVVSIPFKWEEAPGRPRPTNILSPCNKPKSVRCLELPPRLLVDEAKVVNTPPSPTTVLNGPRPGRSLSHRFYVEGLSPKNSPTGLSLAENGNHGLIDIGNCKHEEVKRHFGRLRRWTSANGTKWNKFLNKGTFGFPPREQSTSGSFEYDLDIEVKITRVRRRSRGSLYKLSHKSSRVLENIMECLKQMMVRRPKQENKSRTEPT